ncbi:MAG: hypothetical protein ABJH08_04330 [Balneola sp.]
MTILFWVLLIGGPWILGLFFSPPGPGYILTLFLHYPVWYGLKLLSDFAVRKTEINESYIIFAVILIGLGFTMKFYQMGGEGKPFLEAKTFVKTVASPSKITNLDKYPVYGHEGYLKRGAALGKFYGESSLDIALLLSSDEFRMLESYFIEKKSDSLVSNLPKFQFTSINEDYQLSFSLRNEEFEVLLSELRYDGVKFSDGYSLKEREYYGLGSGLGHILYYYFRILY